MAAKLFAAIVAAVLFIGFISPVVLKLKNPALAIVALTGIVMMLVDLWQSSRSK